MVMKSTSVTEAPSSTSHTALYRCSATRSSISITGSFRSPQTTEELHDHARNSTPTGPRQRKCQAPTGTTVAQEPELRPRKSSSYRNPMVKHEPELHTHIGKQIGKQSEADQPERVDHDDKRRPDQGFNGGA